MAIYLAISKSDVNFKNLEEKVQNTRGTKVIKVIGFFDLTNSTTMKLSEGHTIGTKTALLHNLLCRQIVESHNGKVVKELGDGVLVSFKDSLHACLAAIDFKRSVLEHGKFLTKGAMTIGEVEELEVAGIQDILGSPVDRCARIASAALPGQILLDSTLYEGISSFLKDYPDICIGQPESSNLKDIGIITTVELSNKKNGFVLGRKRPFNLFEDGRLSISEKVEFMQDAKQEIIELGIGLTTFSEYFESRKHSEFKDHVKKIVENGVVFKCMLLDPETKAANEYARITKEPTLLTSIRSSIKTLKKVQKEFRDAGLLGSFEIYAYKSLPYFHAVCIDANTDAARMVISHYLHGVKRADSPVIQFSKKTNVIMFNKYLSSILFLQENSKKI